MNKSLPYVVLGGCGFLGICVAWLVPLAIARGADNAVGIRPQAAQHLSATNAAVADPAQEREFLARRLRQLSGQMAQARAKAGQADLELVRMGRRLDELQQETVRLRAEYDQRLEQLPQIRELLAAQEAVRSGLSRLEAEQPSRSRGTFAPLHGGGALSSNILMRGTGRSVMP